MSPPVDVFLSFAPQDEELRAELEKHLVLLERQAVIRGWNEHNVGGGEDLRRDSSAHLESAGVILLLVSADFMASDYCVDVEVTRALARAKAGEAQVITILGRAYDHGSTPFAKLQALPSNGVAVTSWPNRDEAWADVAKGIRGAVRRSASGAPDPSSTTSPTSGAVVKLARLASWHVRHRRLLITLLVAVVTATVVVIAYLKSRPARDTSLLPTPPQNMIKLSWGPTDCGAHTDLDVGVGGCVDFRTLLWLQGQFNQLRAAHARGFAGVAVNPRFEPISTKKKANMYLDTFDEGGQRLHVGVGYSQEGDAKSGCLNLYADRQRIGSACMDSGGRWWAEDDGGSYRRID